MTTFSNVALRQQERERLAQAFASYTGEVQQVPSNVFAKKEERLTRGEALRKVVTSATTVKRLTKRRK